MRRLLQKKLGFRMLLDVVPLDAGLVHGSHGLPATDPRGPARADRRRPGPRRKGFTLDGGAFDTVASFGLLRRAACG